MRREGNRRGDLLGRSLEPCGTGQSLERDGELVPGNSEEKYKAVLPVVRLSEHK